MKTEIKNTDGEVILTIDGPLKRAYLEGADGLPDAPKVEAFPATILNLLRKEEGKLDMSYWHTCDTTHCLAGWACVLAGEAGQNLENKIGTNAAGALIFHASVGVVPDFYCSDEEAITWLEEQAGESL